MRGFLVCSLLLAGVSFTQWVGAQGFVFDVSEESGLAGDSVSVSVNLDNVDPIRGFSLGIGHDGSLLTLNSIDNGSALLALTGGAGADYFFTDVNAANGPGGVVGCVISLNAPILDLLPGTDQEILSLDYSISGGATPGSIAAIEVRDDLGDPVVPSVVSVAGVTETPTQLDGSVTIETPPVDGITCTLIDPCTCEFDVTWTNATTYDSIEVFQNGTSVASLGGGATSTTITTTMGSMVDVCVVATANGQASANACCAADCPVLPPTDPPQDLDCTSVDPSTCVVTVTWTNAAAYQSITVILDGAPQTVLTAGETMAPVTLPDIDPHVICLEAVDACGVVLSQVCCNVECGTPFVRGDANSDGGYDISDPIAILSQVFGSMVWPCEKALDANDDGTINIADPIYILTDQFSAGPDPSAPFPNCGVDPTDDGLTCDSSPSC